MVFNKPKMYLLMKTHKYSKVPKKTNLKLPLEMLENNDLLILNWSNLSLTAWTVKFKILMNYIAYICIYVLVHLALHSFPN